MIPAMSEELNVDLEIETADTETYKMYLTSKRILGKTDGIDAVKQAIYKILNTERFQYIIYSWDYGIELIDLYGKDDAYVVPEIERRIKDALSVDDRIIECTDFEFDTSKKKIVSVKFTANTIYGNISINKEVEY